ncbi:hypothetical protein WKH57_00840 [Niallia taxi]|uniref:homing endonuclease associated repeat-containing protein n=1 Tax=Niallia taxi TaxID=2499688 RepID=UPI00317B6D31
MSTLRKRYTKEYLFNCLIEYYDKYGITPTARAMKDKGYPTIHAFINHFGSFKNALIETGLFELRKDKHQFSKECTDIELLTSLKKYMNDKNRIPTHEYMRTTLTPSLSTYDRRFDNGVYGALKLIGYDIEKQNKEVREEYEQYMIDKYKELKLLLGRVPSSRDIERYSREQNFCPAMKTYESHFGSLYNLQLICGFTPTRIAKNKSRSDLIADIRWLHDKLQRVPSQLDLRYFDNIAGLGKYAREFGSWNNAVIEAGLKPNNDIYFSNRGQICLSYYELLFTNMLEDFNIDFEKEKLYNNYMETNKRYRFDYVLSDKTNKLFVEIFGITNNEDYYNKTNEKIKLCELNNLTLIKIYPGDFNSYKSKDIYNMFQQKINTI